MGRFLSHPASIFWDLWFFVDFPKSKCGGWCNPTNKKRKPYRPLIWLKVQDRYVGKLTRKQLNFSQNFYSKDETNEFLPHQPSLYNLLVEYSYFVVYPIIRGVLQEGPKGSKIPEKGHLFTINRSPLIATKSSIFVCTLTTLHNWQLSCDEVNVLFSNSSYWLELAKANWKKNSLKMRLGQWRTVNVTSLGIFCVRKWHSHTRPGAQNSFWASTHFALLVLLACRHFWLIMMTFQCREWLFHST